ncbi:hypothetical protein [Vibrio sinensis]|uniref:hypothetical protein n=1 Tax=Vibrio sinensis TaxID=2302434 RepID=UPI001402D2A9|nr:hypothetical protein [Vibrio sinensis]
MLNSALLSLLKTDSETKNVDNAPTSTLAEIATLAVLFVSTAAVILLLSLTWAM